ncbi:hypothetical protein [Agrococcus jejuensis]|uniref:Uncharacterized protein n=1 Tax=Agrococcus jejuensis TaxID=399736 RepID=A0A1G8EWX4_9MICO|nr:hypothetical protein [Agrococcus jejuensis]SDH74350.1 hypothetical protein SAMN04489720_2224 [Agrococcus jejuensis]
MTEGMPDFAMPSEDDVARQRAQAEDDAREAAARAALGVERGQAGSDVPFAPASEPAPQSAPASPGRRRILTLVRNPVVTFVAGAALVAAAFVAVPAIQRQSEAGSLAELDRVVAEYVGAIEAGDLETASRMAPPDPAYADTSLVDVATTTGAPAFECAEPSVGDDVATVSCTVAIPTFGSGSTMRMRLVRDGGWRVETGLAVASPLFVGLADVETIGGALVPDGFDLFRDPIWLYPGAYDLDITTSPRLETGDSALGVLADGFLWFGGVSPGPEMLDEMTIAAVDYVAACSETAAAGCPTVAPLGPGERFEPLTDGYSSSSGSLELVVGIVVRRIGGAPDQWGIDVRAVFDEDLQSYTVVPAVPSI